MEILFEKNGDIGFLSVHRPEARNALSRKLVNEMENVLDEIAGDTSLRALIVGGSKDFAAGADIKDMVDCGPKEAADFAFNRCYNKLMNLSIPTIAAIDGYALGGGLELALCCDMRIAAHTATLGLPETNLGIMPGAGGTIRLPRLIGYAKACEVILTGALLSGEQAERVGLVNASVPAEELMDTAVKWAKRIAARAPLSTAAAKETMKRGLELSSVEEGVAFEAQQWAALFATEDQKEGMSAFLEKRKAIYRGR